MVCAFASVSGLVRLLPSGPLYSARLVVCLVTSLRAPAVLQLVSLGSLFCVASAWLVLGRALCPAGVVPLPAVLRTSSRAFPALLAFGGRVRLCLLLRDGVAPLAPPGFSAPVSGALGLRWPGLHCSAVLMVVSFVSPSAG